jgi:predicted nucleic acid-binding protein
MKVIYNTTPIISLASIGKLDILKELFNEIKAKKRLFLTHNSKVKVSKKNFAHPTWLNG